jgi:PAS domain S-box-containing protein
MPEDRPSGSLPTVDWQQAAEMIAEQRERLRVTLASIGDAVITTDDKGRITSMNAVAQSLTGWTEEEAKGQPLDSVFRIVNETTRQPVENPALRALREGIIVGLANHTVLIHKDGSERAIDDSTSPIRDSHGKQVGAVLVFRDITERRRLEKENAERLAASRFLAAIVESSEDAIISKNLDGVIQSWNAAAERLFGYTAQEAIGQPISLIISPDRIDEEAQILIRIHAGERVNHFETVRIRKDGSPVDISLTVSPMKDEAGHVIGASKIARDITEKKQAEKAIETLNAELTAEVRSIGFLQEMSTRMLAADDFSKLLDHALDAAIKITNSDMGNIQLFEGQGLKIAAQRGFETPFLDFFNNVQEGQAACGAALAKGERIIVEDVANSPIFEGSVARDVVLAAGVRSVQSTPLISRSGQIWA